LVAAILATLMLLAPVVSAADQMVDYPENGTDPVMTFNATDADGDAIEWDLSGVDAEFFEISDDGVLTFEDPPDFEDAKDKDEDEGSLGPQGEGDNVYQVTVEASGGTLDVAVTVTNVDEDGSVSFSQPQPQATRDLEASFSDEDGEDSPSWQWARGPSATGPWTDITSATTPKRNPTAADVGSYLRATVSYTDSFGAQTAYGVTDSAVEARTLANAAPKFDDDIDGIPVKENVKGNIGELILASDGDNDVLLYTFGTVDANNDGDADDNDNDLFNIGKTTGQLSLKDNLDFEVPGTGKTPNADDSDDGIPDGTIPYTVVIVATDPSGATDTATVSVFLSDVNEAPEFTGDTDDQTTLYVVENTDGNPSIFTNMALSTAIADYTAEDEDGAETTVAFTLEGAGDDEDSFELTTAGALTAATTFDHEKQDSYSLVVIASSGATADDRDLYTRLAVTVKVVDREDTGTVELSARVPQIGRPVLATLDDEDGGVTAVSWKWYRGGTIVANPDTAALDALADCDPDNPLADNTAGPCEITGASGSALYTPVDADDGFTIHAAATYEDNQGTDRENAVGSSEKEVQASDPANTAPKFPDQDLNTAGDQSDTAMRSVAENDEGADVGEPVAANDTDDGDLLLYSLNGGDASSFKIDRKSGQITTAGELDYETKSEYTVTVMATDPSGAYDMITVIISVIDEDDDAIIVAGPAVNTAPAFDGDTADRMVYENMPADTNVGDPVTATEDDIGQTLTYSLNGGGGNFEIDPASGQITTTASLDYETTWSYSVTVTASDGQDENSTDTIDVTITVGDMYPGCTMADEGALTNDCETLLAAKDDLRGEEGSLDWSEDTSIMDWTGVVVGGDAGAMRVTQLRLHGQGLNGTIPGGLGNLGGLETLYLHNNRLTGAVPGGLGALTNLTMLRVDQNELDGLEEGLGGASSLVTFFAHRNHLTGSIPGDLGDLDNLEFLRLDQQKTRDRADDGLTGSIPAGLGDMDSIKRLYLHKNQLSGSIPAELGSLDTLLNLRLDDNNLSGAIPDLSGMTSLVWLGLYDNELTGGIPATLGSLSNLDRLYLHNNNLTGTVPSEIGNLTMLTNLWLKNNQLTGALPNSLESLAMLDRVRIAGNDFTGCIPAALANARDTGNLDDLGLETCNGGS
jgi:hypothetical protein